MQIHIFATLQRIIGYANVIAVFCKTLSDNQSFN